MGLDAGVFKKRESLPPEAQTRELVLDPETGQWSGRTPEDDLLLEDSCAALKRIGNIATVGFLSKVVSQVLPAESFIMSRVLYSGTHGGDWIEPDAFAALEDELRLLSEKTAGERPPELEQFLSDFSELLDAGIREGNPIVFI